MRKELLLLICLLLSQLTMAGVVSQDEAQQKAMAFMAQRNAVIQQKGMRLAAKGSPLTAASTEASYYVFNLGQANGYVIVSGDDRTPAILGYSCYGTFDESNMPENMQAWMAEYDRQLRFLASHPNVGLAKVQLDEHAAIAPMVKTTWNQGSPYNNMCPVDPSTSQRSVTGCVATAMAQIMAYHKYPAQTTATIPAYTTSEKSINVGAIGQTSIDWNNMRDNYTGSETTAEINAVAKLMQLCGASVQMDYTSNQSGAHSHRVAYALKKYFDYDATTSNVVRDLYRANEWNNLIYNELANRRPVCYGGRSTGGGHEFVIDGYDREGLFHVNWGWGGYKDNYFLLSILDPDSNSGTGASSSTDGYSFNQDAIIGVQPNKGTVVDEDPICLTTESISTTTTTFQYDSNYQGYVVKFNAGVRNYTSETGTFDLAMAAFDEQNNMVGGYYITRDTELGDGWGWTNLNCVGLLTLPDGVYTIALISKLSSENSWFFNAGSEKYNLTATVDNNVLTLSGGTFNLTATNITATGNMEVGGMVNVSATIKNNGDKLFNEVLFLQVDGEDISAKYFEADPGQSDVFDIVYKPTSSGTKTLSIGYKKGSDFVSIGTKSITISAARSYNLTLSNGKVTNASNYVINDDKAELQVSVKNNSSYAYDDCIRTYVFKHNNGSSWSRTAQYDTPVSIAAGATKTVKLTASHLTDGRYWFIMVYKTRGEFISFTDSQRYDDLYDYTVIVPQPEEPQGDGTKENPYSVTDVALLMANMPAGSKTPVVYVKGVISEIIRKYSDAEGTATFNMTDNNSAAATNVLRANSVFFLENDWWHDGHTQIKVGDEVIVCAAFMKDDIPTNVAKEGYIYSLNGITTEYTIVLSQSTAQLKVGESIVLTANVLPEDATDKTVTWKSSNESIVTVDATGKVIAVALGEAEITASCGEVAVSCTVTVVPTPAESIVLSQTSAQLKVGESVTLTATVLPEDATDKTVTWRSSNESIATVDATGKVTAVALGEAEITASCGEAIASCTVTVVPTPAESITLSQTSATLKVGESVTLSATVLPEDATDKTVTWTSSNESIVTVDATGKVTAVAFGEAEITASCGEAISTCTITVVPTPAESIVLSQSAASLKVGESVILSATVLPEDATDKTVTWTSSNESVVTVDATGKVTAVALGEAEIIASCSEAIASCLVTVVPTPAESIVLSQSTETLKVGESVTLTATVLPEDATDKTVTWTSSNESIATVDATGTITAVALGETEITASCGEAIASCTVTVVPILVESITLTYEEWSGEEGDCIQLVGIVLPENATDKSLRWMSSDETVATVDSTGLVCIQTEGTCVITAIANDGSGIEAQCIVTGHLGIEEIFVDCDAKVDVYNLGGMLLKKGCDKVHLRQLVPGTYILRQGHRVVKMILK